MNDANGQEVAKVAAKSNEFGSASGSFTLPVGGLTGSFSLITDNGRKSFSVEEYKRPKFKTEFNPIKESYLNACLH